MDAVKPAIETLTDAIAPVEPDWNAIRERYLQGDSLADIALAHGTTDNAISVRAYQQKWKAQRASDILKDEKGLGAEIRGNLAVSCLEESRMFRDLLPSISPDMLDLYSRARMRLYDTTAKLLRWDADPVDSMKHAKPTLDI